MFATHHHQHHHFQSQGPFFNHHPLLHSHPHFGAGRGRGMQFGHPGRGGRGGFGMPGRGGFRMREDIHHHDPRLGMDGAHFQGFGDHPALHGFGRGRGGLRGREGFGAGRGGFGGRCRGGRMGEENEVREEVDSDSSDWEELSQSETIQEGDSPSPSLPDRTPPAHGLHDHNRHGGRRGHHHGIEGNHRQHRRGRDQRDTPSHRHSPLPRCSSAPPAGDAQGRSQSRRHGDSHRHRHDCDHRGDFSRRPPHSHFVFQDFAHGSHHLGHEGRRHPHEFHSHQGHFWM